MKKFNSPIILLVLLAAAGRVQSQSATEFRQMKEITRIATSNLSDRGSRVVFASEGNLESMSLRRWIVSVDLYPKSYRTSLAVMSGPPCVSPETIKETCSIQEISGEPLFLGKFETTGQLYSFAGRTAAAARKMLAFREDLKAHSEWSQHQVEEALASKGAKYGPEKKKEFMTVLPLKSLQRILGPMRLKDISSVPMTPPQQWPAYWKVRTVMIGNSKVGLVMYFEPFDGQLQMLYFTGPHKVWDPVTKTFKWENKNE